MSPIESGKVYHIINVKGGTALDLSGTDNSSIIGWGAHQGPNQRWILEHHNNEYVFRNLGNGKYLGLGGEPRDNTPLKAVDFPVKWEIRPDDKDHSVYRIFVPHTPFNVDLSDHGNSNPGTLITIWGKWEGTNQTWRFDQGECAIHVSLF